jgi:16S rRNA (adenine1518-N6/adenine1519-N6)-dimethyltransferase
MSRTTGLRARKALGQHWLVDRDILRRIASAARFTDEDTVIEVGAGKGALTRFLAERARRLIAVEVDPRLADSLRERFAGRPNIAVVETDVLETPLAELLERGGGRLPYVVVGNLPYFIGTAIIRRFLREAVPPRWMIVTLQQQVAENMAAQPGRMSYLSVETQLSAEARVLFRIPPRAFSPPPKVHSAVVRLDVHDTPQFEVDDRDAFVSLVQAGFAAPRKQLRNSLAVGLRISAADAEALLREADLSPTARPADLDLMDWRELYFAHRRREAS